MLISVRTWQALDDPEMGGEGCSGNMNPQRHFSLNYFMEGGGGYSSTIHSMPGQVTTVKDNTDFNISIFVV